MCQRYWSLAELAYPEMKEKSKVTNLSRNFGPKDPNIAMAIDNCKTLRDIQNVCRKYDELNVPKPSAHFSNDSRRFNTFNPNRLPNNGRNQNKQLPNQTPNKDNQNKNTDQGATTPKRPFASTNQDDKAKGKSPFNIRYLNCWRLGHWMRDCPEPNDQNRIENNYDKMKKKVDFRDTANQIGVGNDRVPHEELERIQAISYDVDSESNLSGHEGDPDDKVKECSAVVTPFGHHIN